MKDREVYKGSILWVRREEREVGRGFGGRMGGSWYLNEMGSGGGKFVRVVGIDWYGI